MWPNTWKACTIDAVVCKGAQLLDVPLGHVVEEDVRAVIVLYECLDLASSVRRPNMIVLLSKCRQGIEPEFPNLHDESVLGIPWLMAENPTIDRTIGRLTIG